MHEFQQALCPSVGIHLSPPLMRNFLLQHLTDGCRLPPRWCWAVNQVSPVNGSRDRALAAEGGKGLCSTRNHKVLLVEFNKGALVSFFLLNKVLLGHVFGFESVGRVCVSNFSLSPFYSLKRGRCRRLSKTPGRDSAFLPVIHFCACGGLWYLFSQCSLGFWKTHQGSR